VELVDTAGVRTTDDPLERLGIERALLQAEAADLVLKVLDRSEPLQDDDRILIQSTAPGLVVASKADLTPAWALSDPVLAAGQPAALSVSSETGEGLERLIEAIVTNLMLSAPEAGAGVPFRLVDLDRLQLVKDALDAGDGEAAMSELESWFGGRMM
jgi:tRNA modification GTPase